MRQKTFGERSAQVYDVYRPSRHPDLNVQEEENTRFESLKEALRNAYIRQDEGQAGQVMEELERLGQQPGLREEYTRRTRHGRRDLDKEFQNQVELAIARQGIDKVELRRRLENFVCPEFDLHDLSSEQRLKLTEDFQDGNFLYHGAKNSVVCKILESGVLSNLVGLQRAEDELAKQVERKPERVRGNSGWEGISWNLNRIDALFGDRYHLAGFVGSPQVVLGEKEQFTLPSRPAPYELIQIPKAVDPNTYYALKHQLEAYETFGLSSSSVLGELIWFAMQREKPHPWIDELPVELLLQSKSDDEIDASLKDHYVLRPDETIELHVDLRNRPKHSQVSLLGVWLHGLIAAGRLQRIQEFSGVTTVREACAKITDDTSKLLASELFRHETKKLHEAEKEIEDEAIKVDTSQMYLAVPRRDVENWRNVLVATNARIKGLLVYSGSEIRMEDMVTPFTGDGDAMTKCLRQALPPPGEGYLDWDQIFLGKPFQSEMRSGYMGHIVRESVLPRRPSILKNAEGKLCIKTSEASSK